MPAEQPELQQALQQIAELRAELQQQRVATTRMFQVLAFGLTGAPNAPMAVVEMMENIHQVQAKLAPVDLFDHMATAALRAAASKALQLDPDNPEVLELYRGVHQGQRH